MKKSISFLYYVLLAILLIVVLMHKVNFHGDEIFSYGLSNFSDTIISYEDNVYYQPASSPFYHYMTVDPQHRFLYRQVWENQKNDVHPPLYYAVLHTICSFFPETFSIWYAGVINIVFLLLTLFVFRKTVKLFFSDTLYLSLLSLLFVASAGVLSEGSFLRMYAMTSFWTMLLTWLLLKDLDQKPGVMTLCAVSLVTVCGALTHYYFIVYAGILLFACAIHAIKQKHLKQFYPTVVAMAIGGIVMFSVFPSSYYHIFKGYRGSDSLEKMKSTSIGALVMSVKEFLRIVNGELLGGLVIFFVLIAIFMCVFARKKQLFLHSAEQTKRKVSQMQILLVSVCGYFVLIAKIAIFKSNRYMFPIYPELLLVAFSGLFFFVRYFVRKIKWQRIISIAITVAAVCFNFAFCPFDYLYRSNKDMLSVVSKYSDLDCLYVYDQSWRLNPSFREMQCYKGAVYMEKEQIHRLNTELFSSPKIIVVIIDPTPEEEQTILSLFPKFSQLTKIGSYDCTSTYLME